MIYCRLWEFNFLKINFNYINDVLKKFIKNSENKFKIFCERKKQLNYPRLNITLFKDNKKY